MNIRLLLYVDFEKTILKIRVLFLLWVFLHLTLPPVSTQKKRSRESKFPTPRGVTVAQAHRLIALLPNALGCAVQR